MVSAITVRVLLMFWMAFAPAPPQQQAPADTTRSPHGALAIPCQNCHTFSGWKPIRAVPEFDHNKTRFPLRGMHKGVACAQCHINPVFTKVGHQCADCHADIHRRQMGANCAQCHTVMGWTVSMKSVQEHQNRFPLVGAHALLECDACHKGAASGQFQGLPTDCTGCHIGTFMRTASPNHQQLGFPTDCKQCHASMDTWLGAKFDHAKFTGFALSGAHASLDCASCHVGGRFQGTPASCVGCHLKDFTGTTNPNHAKLGFPQTCAQCHNTNTWLGATFDHTAFTGFALTGAHAALDCAQCHVGGNFQGTPTDCASCHLKDFNGTTNPNHAAAGFPRTCAQCHTTASWAATFDHSSTGFALTGAHASLACAQCHVGGKFAGTPTDCISCHAADFNSAKNPDHAGLGFPQTCTQCHTTTAWTGASFDHAAMTGFPLTGAHATVACMQCHVGGKFAGTPADCASCHIKDFNATTNPNHAAAGFPTDCSICHSTTQWTGAKFDHSTTQFPLTGAHLSLSCASCHSSGVYKGLSTACVSCHLTNFNSTNNPNHVMAGFPQQCELCHSTSAWQPSTFNHNNTSFPLTGAHTSVACASCHVGGRYAGTPTDCYSCHSADYKGTTDPNHAAAAFPTTCTTCHTTSSWSGATFNHTWFPIYSGTHAGKWTTCADCHTNPSNYVVFTCTSCHAHDKATTDQHHTSVRNYVYNSTNCYACHPTGQGN